MTVAVGKGKENHEAQNKQEKWTTRCAKEKNNNHFGLSQTPTIHRLLLHPQSQTTKAPQHLPYPNKASRHQERQAPSQFQ